MTRSVVLIMPAEYAGKSRPIALPPLNMLYLASYLKSKGIDVTVFDQQVDLSAPNEYADIIADRAPDLVGITSYTPGVANALQVARAIRARTPKIPIVMGGAHASATKGELFRYTDAIDFICEGEGEYTLEELTNNIENEEAWPTINGLIFKQRRNGNGNGKSLNLFDPAGLVVAPPREREPDLANFPFMDFSTVDGFDIDKYSAPFVYGGRSIAFMASRGCPFMCSYCGQDVVHGRRVRYREPKHLIAELKHHRDTLGVEHIQFKDSTFTVNKKWVREVCAEMKNEDLGLHWGCNSRVDTIDEDLCQVMIDAGCTDIAFGVESGDQDTLNLMLKGTKVGPSLETMRMMRRQNVVVRASYMIGNPSETTEQARNTIKFAVKSNAFLTTFNLTCAMPGTELYRQALERGELKDSHWYMKQDKDGNFYNAPYADGALQIEGLNSFAELQRAYRRFYLRPAYFWQLFKVVCRSPLFLKHCFVYAKRIIDKKYLWKKARTVHLDGRGDDYVDKEKAAASAAMQRSVDLYNAPI